MSTDLSDPVVKAIVTARVSLLFNKPFFGNLATRLQIIDASKWCDTAATDGKHLFFNREFIKSLTSDELVFLICHEVLHCVYDHIGRRGSKDAHLWNIANDYIVNSTLVHEKVGSMPKGGLIDKKYTHEMSSEEVYRLLEKQNTTTTSKLKTLDKHMEYDGSDESDSGNNADNSEYVDPGDDTGVDYTKHPPVYSESEMETLRQATKTALINAIRSNEGNTPAGIKRMVDEFVNPTIDWKQLLAESIQATFKDDYSFSVPSRRSFSYGGDMGIILPSLKQGKTIDICVSLDTSGSISNEIFTSFLSEVKGIMEQYDNFRLHIWCIDAAIYNPKVFTQENIDELDDYEPAGGGGNDFPLNWSYMRDNDIEPEMFVVFSDGYPCGSWGDPDYCDTIFVIKNEWDKNIEAPFGLTVYMD